MIVCTMNLVSAVSKKRDAVLVTITIANDGTTTGNDFKKGSYNWTIHGRSGRLLKRGHLANWPRMSKTPLALLQRVINDAYPPKVKP